MQKLPEFAEIFSFPRSEVFGLGVDNTISTQLK